MAERIEGYNENKDYTGFVCELEHNLERTLNKLNKLGVTPPDNWIPDPEGFSVKQDHGEDMLIQFCDVDGNDIEGPEFWIKFEDAVSYWA